MKRIIYKRIKFVNFNNKLEITAKNEANQGYKYGLGLYLEQRRIRCMDSSRKTTIKPLL